MGMAGERGTSHYPAIFSFHSTPSPPKGFWPATHNSECDNTTGKTSFVKVR